MPNCETCNAPIVRTRRRGPGPRFCPPCYQERVRARARAYSAAKYRKTHFHIISKATCPYAPCGSCGLGILSQKRCTFLRLARIIRLVSRLIPVTYYAGL